MNTVIYLNKGIPTAGIQNIINNALQPFLLLVVLATGVYIQTSGPIALLAKATF